MGSVTVEVRGAVAVVVMDNSSRMNAIDAGIAEGLATAASERAAHARQTTRRLDLALRRLEVMLPDEALRP